MHKIFVIALLSLMSCSSNNTVAPAQNGLDAARLFIENSLQGNFKKASAYVLINQANTARLTQIETSYNNHSNAEKKEYNQAVINIHNVEDITPQQSIITYSNSYDKVVRKLKVVLNNNAWVVDIDYTFNGNL